MDPMPRTLDDHLRDRRARVASWLEQRTEAETATAVCERWIADLLARGSDALFPAGPWFAACRSKSCRSAVRGKT